MADVLIRGTEMPKSELEYVSLLVYGDGRVYMRKADAGCSNRLQDLAVILPKGYGRLIDADALIRDKSGEATLWCGYEYQDHSVVFEEDIKNAPTIVPAEGGTDDG